MISPKLLLFGIVTLILMSSVSQAKAWRGIVPLHSTRADVERLLGKPNAKYERYDIGNEEAAIFYSKGRCVNGWDVPQDTVIDIAVSPKQSQRLSDLRIDLSKYQKARDPHVTSHTYYVNRDEGIRYDVYEGEEGGKFNGEILTIYYESTSEDVRLLYCRKSNTQTVVEPCIPHVCPVILIQCAEKCVGPDYIFTARVGGACPGRQPTYKWTLSAGKITKGQGTDTISVDARRARKKPITATVEVGNVIPNVCPRESCYTTDSDKTRN